MGVKSENIVRFTLEEIKRMDELGLIPPIDHTRFGAMSDEELDRAMKEDPDSDDAPLPENALEEGIWVEKGIARVPIRMEQELLYWFLSQPGGKETFLEALREYKERREKKD